MKKAFQLKTWALALIMAVLFAVSAATTSVLANNQTITVKADTVNVRLGPGLSYGVMGQVKAGNQLTIIASKNSWYQVRLAGNKIGWVASWLVDQAEASPNEAKIATVNTTSSVFEYASDQATALATLNAGTRVQVVYEDGNWVQLAYDHTAVWLPKKAITYTGETTPITTPQTTLQKTSASSAALTVKTTTETNLRTAAGINAPVVEKLAANTILTVVKQRNDWYEVKTAAGKNGFVASWTVSAPNDGKSQKAATKLSEATIVIDPGHGGADTGALSNSGKYEKTYTLATAKLVANALKSAGANVIMTRSDDTFVDLAPRPVAAAKAHADAFISIHFDSSPSANQASGFTTYYYDNKKDLALAKSINSAFSGLDLTNRGVAFGNYEVLRDNPQPAILLEMGYINSNKDFKKISSSAYQSKVAADVVNGLTAYFKAGNHQ